MQTDPIQEWRRLTEHYRALGDEELSELAAGFDSLTPTAQQVLRDEMKLRRLGDASLPRAQGWQHANQPERVSRPPQAAGPAIGGALNDYGNGLPVEYTWKALLCDCSGDAQAWQISEMLRRADVESWIEGDSTYATTSGSQHTSIDEGNRRVLVAADQLDQARALLAQPIPQEIVQESETPLEFEPPHCPQCGAADPLLDAVEPANAWRCEVCGAEWTEAAADTGETV